MHARFHNRLSPHPSVSQRPSRRGQWLGYLAAMLSRFSRRGRDIRAADLRRHSYATSTQRLGVRFTERLRGVFRHRWLKKRV